MMPRFQNRALHGASTRKNRLLLLLLRIARQHHGEIAVDEASNDGLIVRVVLVALDIALLHECCRGTQHLEHGTAAKVDTVARNQPLALDMLVLEFFHIAEKELRGRGHAVVVDHADGVFVKQDIHAADVVSMRVREDDSVDLFHVRLFQLGAQLVALVHITCIHKNSLLPRLDEDGVPLPDVQHLDRNRAIRLMPGRRRRRR